jgi:hypothetical protein
MPWLGIAKGMKPCTVKNMNTRAMLKDAIAMISAF